jgi:hypothetical protein
MRCRPTLGPMLRVLLKLLLAPLAALVLISPAQARLFTQPELDALVAPIALYPDGLVSDVLVAATHPDQVFAAAQLPKDAPADEAWDPAVKSLLSFPDVLQRMAESPQWTRDLGEAFVGQEPHVMDTVQSLRRRAQAQGTLKSTDQINVQQEGQAIVVQPRTEVVYVPYYDPYVVYGPWWWPAYQPVYWRPWAPFYVSAGFFFWSRPAWHAHRVVTVNKVTNVTTNVNVQRNFVNRPASQWHRGVESREFHRGPDSQRRAIANSPSHENRQAPRSEGRPQFRGEARSPHTMPAAPRFSDSRAQQAPRVADSRPQQAPRMADSRPQQQAPRMTGQQAPRMTGNAAPRPSQSVGHGGGNGGGRGGFNGGRSGGGGAHGGGGHGGGGGGRGGRG